MDMTKYPLHEELKARAAEQRVVEQTIDRLSELDIELCRHDSEIGRDGEYLTIREHGARLVALIMDIDYDAFMAEKDAMIADMTKAA